MVIFFLTGTQCLVWLNSLSSAMARPKKPRNSSETAQLAARLESDSCEKYFQEINLLIPTPHRRRIVIGSVAEWLGDDAKTTVTHNWVCYVRAGTDEDPTLQYISSVRFRMHESVPNPIRVIASPGPYEVQEQAWGEFEIHIDIFFVDATVPPYETCHMLRLRSPPTHDPISFFPSPESGVKTTTPEDVEIYDSALKYSLDPVVSEFHDELLFIKPSAILLKALNSERQMQKRQTEDVKSNFLALQEREASYVKSLLDSVNDEVIMLLQQSESTFQSFETLRGEFDKGLQDLEGRLQYPQLNT